MAMKEGFTGFDIANGAEVYTSDGKKIGKVKEVSSDQFKIDAPLQPDYWLSCDTIDTCTREVVTIGLPRDALEEVKIRR